jgi:hypothetical protein
MYAIDMLKVAGVDVTTPKPIEDAMALFEQLLNELDLLLKQSPPLLVIAIVIENEGDAPPTSQQNPARGGLSIANPAHTPPSP